MTELITTAGQVATAVITQATSIAEFIMETPLALLGVSLAILGFAVGFIKRFI